MDDFSVLIVNLPFLGSNISTTTVYGVNDSPYSYIRVSAYNEDIEPKVTLLKLKSFFRKFYGRDHDSFGRVFWNFPATDDHGST